MTKTYEELIIEQYNKFADLHREAIATPAATIEAGFAAFMCNNIACGVSKSSRKELKDFFYKYASTE